MKNSIFNAVCKTRYLALLVLLIFTCGNVWGTVSGSIATSISAGDQIVIVNTGEANELTGVTSNLGQQASYSTAPAGTYILTVEAGKSGSGYSFKDGSNNYLAYTKAKGTTKNNNLFLIANPSGTDQNKQCSWTVSINGSTKEATITNVYNTDRSLKFNSDRFCCYTSAQTAIKIFKIAAATPTITPSVAELDWGTVNKGAALTTKTFTITGTNLTSAALVYSASGGYSVSPSGKAGAAGTLSSQILTVTPPSTDTPGTYNSTVSITGGGLASAVTVAVKLTVQQTDEFIDEVHSSSGYEPATPHIEAGSYGTTPVLTDKATLTSGTCEQVHYHFVGWITSAKYEAGTAIAVGDLQTPTSATGATYYAVWAKQAAGGGGTTTKSYGWETADDASYWTISGVEAYDTYKKTGSKSGKIARGSAGESTVQFKNKVNVTSFSFQFLRQTTNNNYNVRIETSSDGSTWDDVESYNMSEFSSAETWYAKSHAFDGETALYVRFVCYTTSAIRWVDDVSITYSGGVSYDDYIAKCCTPLGTISGSVSLSQLASPNPTKLKATWIMTAETGIASYTLEVYDNSDNLVKTINNYTSGDEITGLNPCTTYYVKLYTVSSGTVGLVTYCDGGLISTSSTCTTNGWGVSESLTLTTHQTGASTACPGENYVATYQATSTNVLPSSVSVSIGGVAKTQGTHYTWSVSAGTGTLTVLAANITNSTGNIAITITSVAPAYQFWYGPSNSGDGWVSTAFSDVGNNEWQISNFVMPAFEWDGAKQLMWNVSGSGISATNREFYAMSFAHTQSVCGNYDYYNDGDNKNGWIRGPAAGAKGTLRIYDNKADNGWCAFIPNEYVLKFGSSEVRFFENGSDATVWETAVTDLTTLNGGSWTGSTTYRVGVGDASHNWVEVYNKCAATAASSMGYKTNSGNNWATGLNNISTARGKFRIWINNCTNGNWECHFVPYHRVVFHANWPAGVGTDQYSVDVSVEETNSSIPLASAPSAPTGYHFLGWFDAASGGNQITTARTISAGATSDIDLYAHWSNQTAITLQNNGHGSDGNATATYGSDLGATFSGVSYTGTRYQLLGYCVNGTTDPIIIDAEGNLQASVPGYTDGSSHWICTDAAVTLKAKWSGAGRTITWSANGGTYATTFVLDAGTIALPAGTPTSCDAGVTDTYTTFIGWYTTAAGTSDSPTASIGSCGTKIAGGESCPGADATYFAVWADGALESSWSETTLGSISSSDEVVIAMKNSSGEYFALPNNGGDAKPVIKSISVSDGVITTTITNDDKWNISNTAGTLTLYPNGTTSTWLYCSDNNDGVRIGTGTDKAFTIETYETGHDFLYNTSYSRYLGVYNSADWRCYKLTGTPPALTNNISGQTVKFFKGTTGATGFISTCCSSTAVINVAPTSSSLALDIDGNASTTVNFSKSGTSNTVWLMEPTIDPAVGASFSGWAGTYKTAAYDLTFNATATGTYTIKEEGQDKGTSCSKYGTATITVAANPILTPSSASVDISASCGTASSATDITVNSRYLSSTSITASIAKSSGSGTFKISSDNSTFDTSNKTITGGTSSKATSHIYVRYDAIADETGSAEGTLTLTCGAKVVEIPISATVTCNCNIRFTSAADLVRVTAANGIWVQANSELALSGSYLKTNPDNANVSIRAYTDNAHFQLKTSGATGEGAAKTSSANALALATNNSSNSANGWTGAIGIVYKPAAHNTTETATLTVEVYRYGGSTVYSTTTYTLYGRSLPENFVIAVTDGSGNWFAIPADMVAPWGNSCSSGLSTYTPYPIEVNNTTTPTAISGSTPSRAVYTAAARTGNANTNPQTLSFKSVPLAGSGNYYLYGSVSAEGSATNIQNASNASSEKQKWFLDVIDWSTKKYNMHLASDLNTNLLSYYTGSVGQYSASGKKADIYILPATSTCTNYIAPKNITCAGIDATNYTIQFKPDRTKNYEISLNGSSWSDATTSIVNECTDDDHPTLVSAEIPLATYRGQTVYIRVKDAGGCAESTTFDVPNPNVTVNAGTWMSMSGIAGYAFNNTANSVTISGLASCGDQTVGVTCDNSKISASVNQSTGAVTISMTAGNATAGTHTGQLTFTLTGGTTRTQNISITLITKATQEWDGGDVSHFWDGMLCDEEGILVNPTVYLSYDMYYNGSRISTIGDFNSYSTIYLKDLNTGTNVTAHSMTRLKASDGVYGVDLINLTSYRDLIVGHKYRLVWENHSEDNSIQDAVTNSSGVPYSDCHMDFVYTQDCSSPTLLPGCASGTTADVSWGNTKASCSNYTLEWFDRTESSLTNTSIKDKTSNLIVWANGASCYEANNIYLDDWIISNNNNDYKSATYGYQVGGTSVKNYIFTPRLNQLYASAGTSTVYEVTVTLQNTGTANAYAAQCYAVDNTTSSTSVITSGYSATYNGVSTTYFVTPQCPTSSTIESTFKVTGLTATSRIGFTCQTQGQKLYVKNVAIKRLVDGDHSSATIAKSEDSYTITGLTTGKTYYATLTCGSSTSNEITFTTASGTPSVAFYSDAGFTSAITEADVVPGTPKTVYVRGTNVYFCGEEIPVTINSCFNIDSKSLEYNSETHVLEGNITVSNICAAADGPLTVSISGDHELLLHCTGDHQIEVVQWATNGLKIESYVIVSGTPSSGALNVTTSGGTYDLSHASLDITAHANEYLKITWNGRVENFRIPVFINSSCNSSTLSNVTEESVIVVNANKTLTINSDLVCAGVEIYPMAKVQFSSGSLTADYIRLYNNGDTWANFAKLDVTGASTISVDNVYADFRINEDRYHYIALPFDIETDDVTYAAPIPNGGTPALRDATNNRAFYVRQYDGRARETNDKATETTYNVNMPHIGAKGGNYAMTAGRGYMIAIGDQNSATGHAKRTLRFPIAMNSTKWTAEKASSKVVGGDWVADGTDNASARATNKGWNLVGNPFMRELTVTSTSGGLSTGYLDETGGTPMWQITDDGVRYITIYNAATDAFTYQPLNVSFTLKPMAAFYLQMKSAKYINFQAGMVGQAAAMPGLMRFDSQVEEEVNVIISLSNADQADKAGIVLHSKYDVAYNEADDADYPKLMSGTQVALWSIAGEEPLASNGLPKAATENIPLGFQAPQTGQYTFALDVDGCDMKWLKHVWLTDLEKNISRDLLLETYEFEEAQTEKREDRFLLGVELFSKEEIAEGTEIIDANNERPQKFIWQDKMYILRGGVIYDATGKRVGEINK